MNIAIDGPMGAGKTTIADEVAKRLNILHLDTGAMYRAFAYMCVKANVDDTDEVNIKKILDNTQISIRFENGKQVTYINGENVNPYIRSSEISMKASAISKLAVVRTKLVAEQRNIAKKNDIVLDGRDIGTNVLTDADIKIFLTASAETRAMRRYKEQNELSYDQILADLNKRDLQDSTREINPLKKAEDAILVDTSNMSFEESVQYILNIVEEHYAGKRN